MPQTDKTPAIILPFVTAPERVIDHVHRDVPAECIEIFEMRCMEAGGTMTVCEQAEGRMTVICHLPGPAAEQAGSAA